MYVIMKERQSPIAIFPQYPYLICATLKQAKKKVAELNKKAQTNHYWYEKVKMLENE